MNWAATCLAFLALACASTTITPRDSNAIDPEPCNGNCSYVHDPSVVKHSDGTWYRFSTNGNIAIASAPNITGPWTYEGPMMPGGSVMHPVPNDGKGPQELWAPDVHSSNGHYIAYYTASRMGFQGSDIGYCTSDSLSAGTWTDHGSIGIPIGGGNNNWNNIDPNWFNEGDGQPVFMNFGSGWAGIEQTQLDAATSTKYQSNAPPGGEIYNSTDPPGQNYPAVIEGSFEFWLPNVSGNKYYYMFFSSGACCNDRDSLPKPGDEYKIMVCRATTALGPFTDANGKSCLHENGGTLVLGSHGNNVYAPGGQGVMTNPDDGRVIMYYHYVRPSLSVSDPYAYENFQFGFNYLDFSSGWPVVVAA